MKGLQQIRIVSRMLLGGELKSSYSHNHTTPQVFLVIATSSHDSTGPFHIVGKAQCVINTVTLTTAPVSCDSEPAVDN